MMKMINLTSETIKIASDAGSYEIRPSGDEASIEKRYNAHQIVEIEGHRIGISAGFYGTIKGLPEPARDTFYIVSEAVANHANRKDVLYPGQLLLNSDRCEGLVIPGKIITIQENSKTSQILQLDTQGMSQANIAAALGITPQSVSQTLKRHRRKTAFADDELCLIADALNGTRHTAGIPYQFHIISNIVDAIEIDSIDHKWKVDRAVLSAKLNALTEHESEMLVSRMNAFWEASPHQDVVQGLRQAGL